VDLKHKEMSIIVNICCKEDFPDVKSVEIDSKEGGRGRDSRYKV